MQIRELERKGASGHPSGEDFCRHRPPFLG